MSRTEHILIIDDVAADAESLARALREPDRELHWERVESEAELRFALRADGPPWKAVLCDHGMAGLTSERALEMTQELGGDLPFFLVSGAINDWESLELLRAGARDCFEKDNLLRLRAAIQREDLARGDRRQREAAERALRESEARYRSLFERINSGVAVYRAVDDGADFVFVDYNRAGVEMDGADRDQALGRRVTEVFPGIKEMGLLAVFRQVWRSGEPASHPIARYRDNHLAGWRQNDVYKLPSGELVAVYEDLTEIKQAEEELRRWALVFERAQWGVALSSRDGERLEQVNPAYARMHGYTVEALQGRLLADLYPPEERGRMAELAAQVEAEGFASAEMRHRRKDGSTFPVQIDLAVIRDETGAFLHRVANVQDITERQRAEQLLAENEARFRGLFENAPISLWEEDLSGVRELVESWRAEGVVDFTAFFRDHPQAVLQCVGRIIVVNANRATLTLFGAGSLKEVRDRLSEMFTPEALDFFRRGLERLIAGESGFEGETNLRTLQGEALWVRLGAVIAPGMTSNWRRVQVSIQDLTERHRWEETLREYSSIAAASSDHMALLDRNYIYRTVNDAYSMAHARDREEIIGRSVPEMLGESAFVETIKPRLDACLAGESVTYRDLFHFAGMGDRWMDVHYHPYRGKDGGIVGVVVVARDISDLKELEGDLRLAKEQAEAASRAKSAFLAAMSHEIRTPMHAIMGMADLLAEAAHIEPQAGEYARILKRNGEALLVLINDILDITRLETGRMVLEPLPFDLPGLAAEVVETFRVLVREKGIALSLERDGGVHPIREGDGGRLRQVLVNLVSNAVKFTERGGVTVRISSVAPDDDSRLLFEVIDTGLGVAPEKREEIFEVFSQADGSVTRRFGGSGLGLAISRDIVGLMGGVLAIESHPGRGSRFHFTLALPMVQTEAAPRRIEPEAPTLEALRRLRGMKVLLVEDAPDNVVLIRTYLKKTGVALTVAEDGAEAVERVWTEGFHLVLMDVQMPVMDGHSATRAIRAWELREGRPRMTILALTAHAIQGDREKSLEAGCDGHLVKPISKARLLSELLAHAPAAGG